MAQGTGASPVSYRHNFLVVFIVRSIAFKLSKIFLQIWYEYKAPSEDE